VTSTGTPEALQPLGIGCALVRQRVEFCDDYVSGRQSSVVRRPEGGEVRILQIRFAADVVAEIMLIISVVS
jgi:hypothetical protein